MIEVIYKKNEEQEEKKETGEIETVKLPKNIRQIGDPGKAKKIYIEDYVVTYLSGLALPTNTYSRGAILLGTTKYSEDGQVLFISGALEAQNLELDLDETVFTNETWAGIYDNIQKYFPDLEVVGWFLSRLGFSTELNDKIIKTHLEHFTGKNRTLYMIDSLEGEDAFYMYENGGLIKQKGYYIYYEKNEAMQSYMISNKEETRPKIIEKPKIVKKDEALIKNYRKTMEKKKPQNSSGFFYVASTMLTVAILAVGITIINNYDKMKLLEATVNQMAQDLSQTQMAMADGDTKKPELPTEESNATIGEPEATTAAAVSTTESVTTEAPTTQAPTTEAPATRQPATTEKQNTSTPVSSKGTVQYYTVKEGDTIIGISKKMYKSSNYVNHILKANKLSADDTIFPGQKIIIPSLK